MFTTVHCFFYRLLSSNNGENIERCKQILSHGNTYVDQFVEELDGFEVDRLFEEFDTLSVVYQEGSERFLKRTDNFLEEEAAAAEEKRRQLDEEEEYLRQQEEELRAQQEVEQLEASHRGGVYHAPPVDGAAFHGTKIQFNPTALMDPDTFERTWKSLPIAKKIQVAYTGATTDAQQFDSFFLRNRIKSVAKGGQGGILKFFLYAQEQQSATLFLVELVINLQSKQVAANLKSTNEQYVGMFEVVFNEMLLEM